MTTTALTMSLKNMTRARFSSLSIFALALLALTTLTACGEDDADAESGEGVVQVAVYGEDFIEQGIPASEMTDSWAVTFDRFVVTVEDVVVGGVSMPNAGALDISVATDGSGHTITSAAVPAGSHSDSSFAITRVEAAGSATKDGVTKTFDWTFDQRVDYTACETTTEVADGGNATFQVTVHADHFFYDSLVSEDPQLVFQTLADADTDGDNAITRAELEASDIGSLDAGSGGDVNDLWAWLVAQNATLGHVDGEGHCDAQTSAQ